MGTLASALGPVARELTGAPRVYVDANVPAGLVGLMRHELGWDVLSVVEHDDLRRAPDEEHFRRAFDLSRTLVTLDHDYFDTRRFPDFQNPGVIVCTAPDERRLASLLRELFNQSGHLLIDLFAAGGRDVLKRPRSRVARADEHVQTAAALAGHLHERFQRVAAEIRIDRQRVGGPGGGRTPGG